MKKIILIITSLLQGFANYLSAQNLNQDGEGNSSIIYQGINISFDITKTNLGFSYTNLRLPKTRIDQSYKPKIVYGVNASGKNTEGISNLFVRGDIQPEAGLNGFFGVRYRLDFKPSKLDELDKELDTLSTRLGQVTKEIEILKDINDIESIEKKKELDKEKVKLDNRIDKITNKMKDITERRVRKLCLLYFRAGRTATAFRLAKDNPAPNGLNKIFEKTSFEGNFVGLGANYEYGRWLFGLSMDYELTNNLTVLDNSTYNLTTTTVQGNQTLTNKEEITAYSGDYKTFARTNISADIIMFSSLAKKNEKGEEDENDKERNYIAWNFYIRHKVMATKNKDIMPTFTNIGLGAYFFNKSNKFLGGIYVEAPDFFQGLESVKEKPNFRPLEGRLTFGIVTRFNFASFVGPSFR